MDMDYYEEEMKTIFSITEYFSFPSACAEFDFRIGANVKQFQK